jgi:hypothetical protein
MAGWSEDHMAAIGSLHSTLWFSWWNLVQLEIGRGHYGKVETTSWEGWEWYVANWQLQCCSPRLCRLRIDGLAPASKYRTYRSHASNIGPLSGSSCVTIGPKSLSPTPGLSHGRKNKATLDDGWASLSLVGKTSSECRGLFRLHGSQWKVVTYGDYP